MTGRTRRGSTSFTAKDETGTVRRYVCTISPLDVLSGVMTGQCSTA